jgi:hypothetical protein
MLDEGDGGRLLDTVDPRLNGLHCKPDRRELLDDAFAINVSQLQPRLTYQS